MKNIRIKRQPLAAVIPFSFAAVAAFNHAVWAILLAILSLYFIIGINPLLRKRANLWTFLFVGIAGIPINCCATYFFLHSFLDDPPFLRGLLWALTFFCLLFSLEELVFGVVTRLIFPHQTK